MFLAALVPKVLLEGHAVVAALHWSKVDASVDIIRHGEKMLGKTVQRKHIIKTTPTFTNTASLNGFIFLRESPQPSTGLVKMSGNAYHTKVNSTKS